MIDDDDDRPLGRTFIREWREFRGMSLEALAQAAGMGKGNLSKVERGILPYVQKRIERMAEALHCTPADLIGRPPTVRPWLEQLMTSATEQQRDQLAAIAEVVIGFNHAPADPDAALAAMTAEIAARKKRPAPRQKQKQHQAGDDAGD